VKPGADLGALLRGFEARARSLDPAGCAELILEVADGVEDPRARGAVFAIVAARLAQLALDESRKRDGGPDREIRP